MGNVKETIAKQLKIARENAGLTQIDVADMLDMERGSYAQYETGRNLVPIDRLFEISRILETPVYVLLGIPIGKLAPDEADLLHLYRLIPAYLKETVFSVLRSLTRVTHAPTNGNNQQSIEIIIPERNEAIVPDPEEIIPLLKMLDEPERYFVYDYIIWRLQDQQHRRNSSSQRAEREPRQEQPETIEIIELLLAVHGADELAIEEVIVRLRKMQSKMRRKAAQAGANDEQSLTS